MRLGGPRSRPFEIVEVLGNKPTTSWLVERYADHSLSNVPGAIYNKNVSTEVGSDL